MGQMIYKCDPENAEVPNCVYLRVMHEGNHRCFYRTDAGNCARLTDRQMKAVVDKLARAEESVERKHQGIRDRIKKQVKR